MKRFLILAVKTANPFRYETDGLNLAEMYHALGFYVFDRKLGHALSAAWVAV